MSFTPSKSDQAFLDAASSPDALGERLGALGMTRKIGLATCVFLAVVFFILHFMDIRLRYLGAPAGPGTIMILAVAVVVGLKTLAAHSEIRALLLFRQHSTHSKTNIG